MRHFDGAKYSGEWDNDRAVWKECLPHAAATSPPPRDHPHGSRWRVWGKGADHRGSRHARASLAGFACHRLNFRGLGTLNLAPSSRPLCKQPWE